MLTTKLLAAGAFAAILGLASAGDALAQANAPAAGQGWYGGGMMMGRYGMGPGMMSSYGGTGWGCCGQVQPTYNLTTTDVTNYFTNWLAAQANPHLKLGKVDEKDANTIVAEIVTQEGSLAQRYSVDRHTGIVRPAE